VWAVTATPTIGSQDQSVSRPFLKFILFMTMVVAAVCSGWVALVSVLANEAVALLWLIVSIVLLISGAVIVLFPLRATTPDTGHVLYGVTLINDGYEYYPDWSAMMISEFDDSIKSNLEHNYVLAKSIARRPRDQWTSLIAQSLETDSLDRDDA
jgi:hypothetical protein